MAESLFACSLGTGHLSTALAYVERNPVREQFLNRKDSGEIAALRASTYAGRPFRAEDFVQEIVVRLGRHWAWSRPRKDKDRKTEKAAAAG